MGKHSVTSGRIWRTIVVSGAMLATPLAACGGGDKHAQTTPQPATEDKAAADKAAAKAPKAPPPAVEPAPAKVVAVLTTSRIWVGGENLRRGAVVLASPERLAALSAKDPAQARAAGDGETPADVSGLPFIG